MSCSRIISLLSCVLLALVIGPAATAQDFTNADLVGGYAFQSMGEAAARDTVLGLPGFGDRNVRMTGQFTADGAGAVTGTRSFARRLSDGLGGELTETIDQTFTGTYSLEPDGTGVMTLEPAPNPDWDRSDLDDLVTVFDGTETFRFVLADGGRRMVIDQQVPTTTRYVSSGADAFASYLHLDGHAESQEPATGFGDELERLSYEHAVLSAQLCEVLRLLNTPQGRRESGTPEVVGACGTSYSWNDVRTTRGAVR